MHSFVHSFLIHPFHSSVIIHFTLLRGARSVSCRQREMVTLGTERRKRSSRERERSVKRSRCAALLKIQIGFSFCVQENAPIAVTQSEKEVRNEAKLRPNSNHQPFIGCLGPTTCWQSSADPPPRPLSAESLMEID
jgi:hypothetical protein